MGVMEVRITKLVFFWITARPISMNIKYVLGLNSRISEKNYEIIFANRTVK